MIRISSPRLVPVVELAPVTFATAERESPDRSAAEVPERWERYWRASLADAGLRGLAPLWPGAWHVPATDLSASQLGIVVARALEDTGIPGFPDVDGEVEEELAGWNASRLRCVERWSPCPVSRGTPASDSINSPGCSPGVRRNSEVC